jgi:hypothetical protein
MYVIARETAVQNGLRRYYDGTPCENGHDSGRYTRSGACVGCSAGRLHKYRSKLKPAKIMLEIAVPPTFDTAARVALLEYLQFDCVPAFIKSRV